MNTETDQSHDKIWFLKKGEKVFGPFAAAKVRGFLMDGKLNLSHEVSLDKKNWKPVGQQPEVVPLQMRNQEGFSEQDMDDELDPGKKGSFWMPVMIFLLLISVGIGVSFVIQNEEEVGLPDCHLEPAPGINWNSCNKSRLIAENKHFDGMSATNIKMRRARLNGSSFQNVNMQYAQLEDADLSYTNFIKANLKGANLQNADLRYAILSGADLRYADLTEANLGGVNIDLARFEGAIWSNGKICKAGSIGKCIQ